MSHVFYRRFLAKTSRVHDIKQFDLRNTLRKEWFKQKHNPMLIKTQDRRPSFTTFLQNIPGTRDSVAAAPSSRSHRENEAQTIKINPQSRFGFEKKNRLYL